MPHPKTAPYGAWLSPINADLLASAGLRLDLPGYAEKTCYWLEGRLRIADSQSPYGRVAYRLEGTSLIPYADD